MKRDEKGLSGGERPLRRPVGGARCASNVLGGILMIAMMLWAVWPMTIYEDTLVGFETRSGLLGSVHLLDMTLVIGLLFGILGNILNRGYVWAIRLVNILYSICYYTYFISIFLLLISMIVIRLGNFNDLITLVILLPFVIWTRRSQKNCRWMDLTSSPEAWSCRIMRNIGSLCWRRGERSRGGEARYA
jgi:hypothetical protein